MFTREVAPLNLPILFIASLFLVFIHHDQAAYLGRSDSPPAKSPTEFRGFSTAGETTNTNLGFSERLFRLPMWYTPPVKNPANPWIFCSNTNADHRLIRSQ
jgi:hypothetical protein